MAVAIDPRQTWDYVLECERGQPDATTWVLRPLTVSERNRIRGMLVRQWEENDRKFTEIRAAEAEVETLRLGLTGCRNFKDASGGEVPFSNGEEFLNRLHPSWLSEIANAISERSGLQESDRKNSSLPAASLPALSSRTVNGAG